MAGTELTVSAVDRDEVKVTSADGNLDLTFPNQALRATFRNPENYDNVSVDFVEWCAVLGRSVFSSEPQLRMLNPNALPREQQQLCAEAAARFRKNVLLSLNKTLPEEPCDLKGLC